MKIRPEAAELFYAELQADKHEQSLFAILRTRLKNFERAWKAGAVISACFRKYNFARCYGSFIFRAVLLRIQVC